MKKLIAALFAMLLLAGCGGLFQPMPTPDEDTIATQVAAILTTMPTATGEAEGQPTQPLPTIPPTETPPLPTETTPPTEVIPSPTQAVEQPTVTPTETPPPSPTPQPTATIAFTPSPNDPVARLGPASWTDNMDKDDNWPTGTDKFTEISFRDGVMLLTGLTTTDGWRLTWPELTNFYLEMTFQTGECAANDRYGMIVRVPESRNPDRGYLVGLTCDGKVSLRRWDATVGAKGEMFNLIPWTAKSAVKVGSNQTNRLGLMAIGDRLIVYVNGELVGEARDNTFSKGYFGVFVGARDTEKFTIKVDQVRYWENPTP
ncbi:concanavalin A-like lectin/glucanases superfamily [Bellilinea caldifistulae]|uniref:3-keto-alpha-glucoside-1,2-lyase/3-keto-2-hydroxy-glucal hydratase domain-containing protein n=1 Tax=Bellilinea caldifistulae TaxID=360411 RepID=A0A0P6WW59_9CHLR|nr:family 16 glycoside hydrolase [Bellilinea caldifistulae]KPL74513.1 hypothetical protein AC812_11965 [Bellilinea caldifistulae]GAP11716.1 concanavalin A-like lectin/glucanases superfamily [Bellilinea caldifistulae]